MRKLKKNNAAKGNLNKFQQFQIAKDQLTKIKGGNDPAVTNAIGTEDVMDG